MSELLVITNREVNEIEIPTVNARDLHEFLEVAKDFSDWIKHKIKRYEFKEDVDFVSVSHPPEKGSGKRGARIEYYLTLEMGKELSMLERNEKGKEAREYFIKCANAVEKVREAPIALLSPSEALLRSVEMLVEQEQRIKGIEDVVSAQTESIRRIEIKQSAAEDGHSFFTVLGYCSLKGVKLSMGDMQRLGKASARISKGAGITIDRVRDARFGMVNSYHEEMLDAAFSEMTEGM